MPIDLTVTNVAVDSYGRNSDLVFKLTLEVKGHRLEVQEISSYTIITALNGKEVYLDLQDEPTDSLPADLADEQTFNSLVYALDMACNDVRQAAESILHQQTEELARRVQQSHQRRVEDIRRYEDSKALSPRIN